MGNCKLLSGVVVKCHLMGRFAGWKSGNRQLDFWLVITQQSTKGTSEVTHSQSMKIDHYCWIKNVFKNTCLTNLSISDKTTNIIIEIKHCFELSYVMISFHNLCSPLSKCHPFKALQKNWDKNLITGQVSWCIQRASFELPHLTFQTAALILTTTLIKTCQQTQISHKRSALLFNSQQPSCGWQYWKIHFGCHTHFNCPITTSKSFHSDFKTAGPLIMPFSLPRDKTPKKKNKKKY